MPSLGRAGESGAFGRVARRCFNGPERLEGTVNSAGAAALLYVSLARGGNPLKIVAARSLQSMLCRLLAYLPRLGLIQETAQLLETIQGMEFEHPQGPGAITEFDRVFQIGCKSIVRALVVSSADWSPASDRADKQFSDNELIAPAGTDRRGPVALLAGAQPGREAFGARIGKR